MTPEIAAELLNVPAGASRVEIDKQFRKQARAHHPDLLAGASAETITAACTFPLGPKYFPDSSILPGPWIENFTSFAAASFRNWPLALYSSTLKCWLFVGRSNDSTGTTKA